MEYLQCKGDYVKGRQVKCDDVRDNQPIGTAASSRAGGVLSSGKLPSLLVTHAASAVPITPITQAAFVSSNSKDVYD